MKNPVNQKNQNTNLGYSRIDYISRLVTQKLRETLSPAEQISSAAHLFGVAQNAALLAGMRGQNVELACIAGLLHDLYKATTGNVLYHAEEGSAYVKPILKDSGLFTDREIETVCGAIYFHSDKANRHLPLDEILKDADVMNTVLSKGARVVTSKQKVRWANLQKEFGFKI